MANALLIKTARLSLGLTQTEFAEALDVNLGTVCRWETGKLPVSRVVERAVEHLVSETKRTGAAS